MDKIVNRRHIIGERGAIEFHNYCNKHEPYIIFRPVLMSDFGIDGEVELTATNSNGKLVATGEILKVQIKSTESDSSYMQNETDKSFTYYASEEDFNYWSKHNLDVLLVIYDDRNEKLYCRKIPKINPNAPKKKRKNIPIEYDKERHELHPDKSDFINLYSQDFKSRVSYDVKETIVSNMLKVHSHPKYLYCYEAEYSDIRDVFDEVGYEDTPFFILYSNFVYTFQEITEQNYPEFKELILSEKPSRFISYNEILDSGILRNHYIELINLHVKDFLGKKAMRFSRKYKRYYFTKPFEAESRIVSYETRRMRLEKEKSVVKYYKYGKLEFYRHWALAMEYLFNEGELYILFHPKYYFTVDGKVPLSPKNITKYTNYLTSREFNPNVINNIHFYIDYLSRGYDTIRIYEFDRIKITILAYTELFSVDFGIASDLPTERASSNTDDEPNVQTLF